MILLQWLGAFALTQVVEAPIYRRAGASWRTALLASTLTHPVLWLGFPFLSRLGLGYWGTVVLAEALVTAFEAAWLSFWGVRRALLWSVLANGASVAVGLVVRAVFGWP
jgi:hypothetical protein